VLARAGGAGVCEATSRASLRLDGKAPRAGAEIFIPGAARVREGCQEKETLGNRVNQAGSNIRAPAFLGDVQPDVVKVSFRRWRDTQFTYQARAPALSHFGGKFSHGFPGDHAAFAARERCAGIIETGQKHQAAAFAVFPQR